MKRAGEGLRTEICAGGAQARAFLRLEERVWGGKPPRRFADAKEACRRARGAGGLCLLTTRGGEALARAVVFRRGDTAFFALFAALPDGEAVRALVEAMRAFAAREGCRRLVGPVSPDGSGFDMGVRLPDAKDERPGAEPNGLDHDGESPAPAARADSAADRNWKRTREPSSTGDAPWHPQDPSYCAALLEACGLREESRLLVFRRPLGEDPYAGAARWAAGRGIRTGVQPLGRRSTLEAAWAVCEDAHPAGQEAFGRVYGRVAKLAPRAFAVLAFAGERPVGWVLCVPEGRALRVLQLQVLPPWRGTPCAAALLDTAWQEAARLGAEELVVGTIDSANPHSRPMAEHAGFRASAAWAVYAWEG